MRPLSPTRFCSLPFPNFLLRCPLLILPPSHQSPQLASQFPSARTVNLARTGIRQLPLALLDRSSAGSNQSPGAGNPGIRCTHSGPLPPESWVDLTPLFHVRHLVVIVRIHSPHLLSRIPGSRFLQLRGFEAAESSVSPLSSFSPTFLFIHSFLGLGSCPRHIRVPTTEILKTKSTRDALIFSAIATATTFLSDTEYSSQTVPARTDLPPVQYYRRPRASLQEPLRECAASQCDS